MKVDVIVIGAGVVGMASAARLASSGRTPIILERNSLPGLEMSSRNSGVIHAGLYYPPKSLKSILCANGRDKLYAFCSSHAIPHRQTGKFIVAQTQKQEAYLEALAVRGRQNGLDGLQILTRSEIHRRDPLVRGIAALYCPQTGIIDTSRFIRGLEALVANSGGRINYGEDVCHIRQEGDTFQIKTSSGTLFQARIVVNAAGLGAHQIARLAGIDLGKAGYLTDMIKGEVFRLRRRLSLGRPIYSLPNAVSLGAHLTPDLDGVVRVGPNAFHVDRMDFGVDDAHREEFLQTARDLLLLDLRLEDLEVDYSGIWPALQRSKRAASDFVICRETKWGMPGLINLIGIDSPGLTASLAIAEMVNDLSKEYF